MPAGFGRKVVSHLGWWASRERGCGPGGTSRNWTFVAARPGTPRRVRSARAAAGGARRGAGLDVDDGVSGREAGGAEGRGADDRLAGGVGGVEIHGRHDREVVVAVGVGDDLAPRPEPRAAGARAALAVDHQQLG